MGINLKNINLTKYLKMQKSTIIAVLAVTISMLAIYAKADPACCEYACMGNTTLICKSDCPDNATEVCTCQGACNTTVVEGLNRTCTTDANCTTQAGTNFVFYGFQIVMMAIVLFASNMY